MEPLRIKDSMGKTLRIGAELTDDGNLAITAMSAQSASITVWVSTAGQNAIREQLTRLAYSRYPLTLDPAEALDGCTDASIWARQFMARFQDTQADEGTMLAWFANAIQAGIREGMAECNARVLAEAVTPSDTARRRAESLLEMVEAGLIAVNSAEGAIRCLEYVLGLPVRPKR